MGKALRSRWMLTLLMTGCAGWGCQSSDPSPVTTTPEPPLAAEELATDSADEMPPLAEAPAEELTEDAEAGTEEAVDEAAPEELQAEALELCQSASEFLDRGEIDDAIAALDRAYALMLELPNNGDSAFLQAKEDIRVLVADLLVRTYASQRSVARDAVIAWDLEVPIVDNEHVQSEIRSFSNGEREFFLEAYSRSGMYRPMILAKLEAAGMPSQLSWLPLVESNFKVRALSRASALGLWQFIASTGQRYGLKRDAWLDERMDPAKSTDAAIAYLSELHGIFGDWPKALAAYNCGEARVMRLQQRRPGEYLDFWDLYELLPRETRRYVPRFFAALAIVEDPERYGMTLPEPQPELLWTTVEVNRSVQLEKLDEALGLPEGALFALNPELRHKATPPTEYHLKVPPSQIEAAASTVAELPAWEPPTPQFVVHRVRSGETLSVIARRYGTSVSSIMRLNNLRSANRIWPGQRLNIPVRGGAVAADAGPVFNPVEGTHTVRRGESLYSIASRYKTTVAKLKHDNGLSSNLIQTGQELKVSPGSRSDLRRYQVQRGDTLSAIADAHRVGLQTLLRANGLSSRATIYPGQWLVIPN